MIISSYLQIALSTLISFVILVISVIFVISVVETHPHKGFRSYVTLHSNLRVIKGKIFCENGRLE